MNNQTIYHVFPLTAKYLTLDLIEQFIKYVPQNHFFYIIDVVEDDLLFAEYITFFKKLNFNNYKFSSNIKTIFEDDIPKNSTIVLHGDNYFWKISLLFKNYKKIIWVCWGSGINQPIGIKNKLTFFIKILVYKKLNTIIALSNNDKQILEKSYKCNNVIQLQYISNLNTSNLFSKSDISNSKFQLPVVYLGNNVSCLPTYPILIEKIKGVNSKIKEVVCMLNYNLDKNTLYDNLNEKGNLYFPGKFKTDEKLYSLNEYKTYMNQCNIYICSEKTQSGLGAIYTSLRLGKKVYLSGSNYDFISQLGCHIFNVNELENCQENDFLSDISFENKLLNFVIIEEHLKLEKLIKQWSLLL